MQNITTLIEQSLELAAEMKKIADKQKKIKEEINLYLDNQGSDLVKTGSFVSKKVTRKGSIKMKLLQAKYNIEESEIDSKFRNEPTTYWTTKIAEPVEE
jgi:hypothetical protein